MNEKMTKEYEAYCAEERAREEVYERMCKGCDKEKQCHEECKECEAFLETLNKPPFIMTFEFDIGDKVYRNIGHYPNGYRSIDSFSRKPLYYYPKCFTIDKITISRGHRVTYHCKNDGGRYTYLSTRCYRTEEEAQEEANTANSRKAKRV